MSTNAASPMHSVDAATQHPYAFVFMLVLMLMFGVGRVAKESKTSVDWTSFLHLWMMAYLVLLSTLMSVTTAMALRLLIDDDGKLRTAFSFLPESFIAIAAAVLGVFGFEFLFSKFIIGFGEKQFDLASTLQNFVDQAVAATLKKEADK